MSRFADEHVPGHVMQLASWQRVDSPMPADPVAEKDGERSTPARSKRRRLRLHGAGKHASPRVPVLPPVPMTHSAQSTRSAAFIDHLLPPCSGDGEARNQTPGSVSSALSSARSHDSASSKDSLRSARSSCSSMSGDVDLHVGVRNHGASFCMTAAAPVMSPPPVTSPFARAHRSGAGRGSTGAAGAGSGFGTLPPLPRAVRRVKDDAWCARDAPRRYDTRVPGAHTRRRSLRSKPHRRTWCDLGPLMSTE